VTERNTRLDTLVDVYLRLPSLYSSTSAAAYQSAFERAERLTGRRLSQIPADVAEWEKLAARIVWAGEFTRARTPEARQRAFDGFIGRISAAIRRAQADAAPQSLAGDVTAAWDVIADYVALAENTFNSDGERLLPNQASLSIHNLRARLGHIPPARLDTSAASAALAALPVDKAQSYRNSIRFWNKLIANRARHVPIADLLPSEPVGPLPTLRDRPMDWSLCTEAFLADLSLRSSARSGRRGSVTASAAGSAVTRWPSGAGRRKAVSGRCATRRFAPRTSARRCPGSRGMRSRTGRRPTTAPPLCSC
jgi:hypothetical protein